MRLGQSFENADLVDYYRFRPAYPPEITSQLIALSPRRNCALDLGCGTGKMARSLSSAFGSVVAVDASAAMLAVAQELTEGGKE